MPATLEIDRLQETQETVATRLTMPPLFFTGLAGLTVSTLVETPVRIKGLPQLNVGAAPHEFYWIEDSSSDIKWVTGLGEPHWTNVIPTGYEFTAQVPRKKNLGAIRLLDDWMSTPDELGAGWWAEFEKQIKHTRFGKLP